MADFSDVCLTDLEIELQGKEPPAGDEVVSCISETHNPTVYSFSLSACWMPGSVLRGDRLFVLSWASQGKSHLEGQICFGRIIWANLKPDKLANRYQLSPRWQDG